MERDDIIEYSLNKDANGNAIPLHDDDAGKSIRKKIWKVTLLLTIITVVEVGMGAYIKQGTSIWPLVKWSFVIMTLVKAAYIVLVFMHLGDEKKSLRYVILVPYILFILYLIFIALTEALAVGDSWFTYG
ncbi:MAG: cytochrome C oxidase subunit IV family protein [Cryomorphaceae bacterium]|jgi:cytochrome c oxidase subunit 4|nr:cytochrome C oxidase subunit IV family protein [Cryomorphaceae bacterium]